MKFHSPARKVHPGYTAIELLTVLVLGAIVMGALVVSYGTLSRNQPRVASVVAVPLGTDRMQNFYALSGSIRQTCVAPHYGAVALAEKLREQFNSDIVSATAIYCLPRDSYNTWRPATITYNPTLHGELDTPQKFRAHIIATGSAPAALFRDYRNPLNDSASIPSPNASIVILGYSKVENQLRVNAIYDIDLVRFTAATEPAGIYASVKRYSDDSRGTTYPLAFSGGYDVFYPPSVINATTATQWSTDGFTPLFISFERFSRRAIRETPDTINRFKAAAERPFYFVWWPDPGARHLGAQANTLSPTDPRQAYNHMGGRTAFMFTVPMFPAL